MKKILIALWFILILSACIPNETDVVCNDGFELDQYGQCMPFCDADQVLVGGVCEKIIPVCKPDQVLNAETYSCDKKPIECEEPFIEENGLCMPTFHTHNLTAHRISSFLLLPHHLI